MPEDEVKQEEHPDSQEHKEPKVTKKIPKRSIIIFAAICLVVFLIVGGVFAYSLMNSKKIGNSSKNSKLSTKAISDKLRARRATIDPIKDTLIQIYTDNKLVVRLEIPKGSVDKKHEITVIPYKDAKSNLQIQISPSSLVFKNPVTLTYDLSRTTLRTDAPKVVGKTLRQTGKTQVLQIENTITTPMLISRASEISTQVEARIIMGGTYKLVIKGDQIAEARAALTQKNISTLTILEAGTVLVFNNQKLSSYEKSRIKAVADKMASLSKISPFEQLPALLLQKKLIVSNILVRQAYAADLSKQYIELFCKDRVHTVEEYVIEAQTAQLMGYEDLGNKCLDAAKAKVADEARAVLGNKNATTSEIIRMMQKVQIFGLDELNSALQNQLNTAVNDKVNDVLKDPNASLSDVIKALQDAQVTGQDSQQDALNQKINDVASKEIDAVLNNPNSTSTDIALATQKAQALGLDSKSTQGLEKLKQMSNRSSEEILNNPNSTSQELQNALGQANIEGKDMDYRNKIRERIKDAQQKETQPTPEPTSSPSNSEDLNDMGIDFGPAAAQLLQLMGINSLDKNSIMNAVNKQADMAEDMVSIGPEVCGDLRKMMPELYTGDVVEKCNYLESGQASSDIEKARQEAEKESGKIEQIQSQDYEAPDPDPHMEIDITPTPEPVEVQVDISPTESQNQPAEIQMDSSDNSNQDQGEDQQPQEVQGVSTAKVEAIVMNAIKKFLQEITKK